MELVDRGEELARLHEAADDAPQLVVMRGRRRVGKSFLVTRAFADRRALYFQADEQDESGQLAALAREASDLIPGRPPLRFDDWDVALTFIEEQALVAPLVVVLDEFQWLWEARPALDSMIQRRWDRWQRDRVPVTLVLLGSSLIHMGRLMEVGRPLFGRADYRPLVAPLDYRWAARFAPAGASAEELLRRYAVLGGTPQYQVWAGRGSVFGLIARRILTKGEALYEEPLQLLREDRSVRAVGSYFDILRVIAAGTSRFNEIAQAAGLTGPVMTPLLGRLIELGYVELRHPLDPTRETRRRGVYRIADPFFRFWFRYVFPNRSRLELGRVAEVSDLIRGDLDNHMGPVFEDICREWVGRYSGDLAAGGEVGAWWDRRGVTEIDVVVTRGGRYTLLGSCKWTRRAGPDVLGALRRDAEALGPAAAGARLVVFARGFDRRLVERADREGVCLVGAEELLTGGGGA
ncbi:MAG: ATP-binding protein [Thermoleophilia bacterium]